MKKITLTICCGTTCYVMGNHELLALADHLPARMQGLVDFVGAPCLGMCNRRDVGRPPFVKVDGKLLCEATESVVLEALDHQLGE